MVFVFKNIFDFLDYYRDEVAGVDLSIPRIVKRNGRNYVIVHILWHSMDGIRMIEYPYRLSFEECDRLVRYLEEREFKIARWSEGKLGIYILFLAMRGGIDGRTK